MVFSLFLLLYLLETVRRGSVSLCIPMWSFVWFLSRSWLSGSVWCLHVQNLQFSFLLHFLLLLLLLLVLFVLVKPPPLVLFDVIFTLARVRSERRVTFRENLNWNHSKGLCTLLYWIAVTRSQKTCDFLFLSYVIALINANVFVFVYQGKHMVNLYLECFSISKANHLLCKGL